MKNLRDAERRLYKVEDSLYEFDFPKWTTQIDLRSFTKRERDIIKKFTDIWEEHGEQIPPDVLKKTTNLIHAVQQIMMRRSVDVFVHIAGDIIFIGGDEATRKCDLG